MPNHLGISVTPDDMLNYRIPFILCPTSTAVVAVGNALRERHLLWSMAACGCVEIDEYCFVTRLKTTGIFPVHNTGTGEDCAEFVRMNGVWKLLPMDEVCADSVSPGHVAPINTEWIVLKKEMELAFVVD